jgi:hypothetical protein
MSNISVDEGQPEGRRNESVLLFIELVGSLSLREEYKKRTQNAYSL